MDKRGGGGNQDFPPEIFYLTMPKNFVGEHFCAVFQTFPLAKKIMSNRGGVGFIKILRHKLFVSQCRQVPQENPLLLQ